MVLALHSQSFVISCNVFEQKSFHLAKSSGLSRFLVSESAVIVFTFTKLNDTRTKRRSTTAMVCMHLSCGVC